MIYLLLFILFFYNNIALYFPFFKFFFKIFCISFYFIIHKFWLNIFFFISFLQFRKQLFLIWFFTLFNFNILKWFLFSFSHKQNCARISFAIKFCFPFFIMIFHLFWLANKHMHVNCIHVQTEALSLYNLYNECERERERQRASERVSITHKH